MNGDKHPWHEIDVTANESQHNLNRLTYHTNVANIPKVITLPVAHEPNA